MVSFLDGINIKQEDNNVEEKGAKNIHSEEASAYAKQYRPSANALVVCGCICAE